MLTTHRFKQLVPFTLVLLFLASATFVSAQVDQTAELKVTINDVITFTLNDANPTLVFDEAADFINGVTYTAASAGVITSSGTFSLSVTADKDDLKDDAGNAIDVGSVFIQATGSNIGTATKVSISKDEQDIISAAPAAISKTFGVTYSTAANDTEFIGKPAGDYTVNLTFTATLD